MNKELTAIEIKIRELAEKSNPYDKICPNRHLWNEGFVCALETYKAESKQPEVLTKEWIIAVLSSYLNYPGIRSGKYLHESDFPSIANELTHPDNKQSE